MSSSLLIDEQYAEFLKTVELFSIAVIHSAFRIRRDAYLDAEETQNEATLRCIPSAIGERSFDLRATLSFRVKSRKKVLMRLSATYELHLHSSNVNESLVEQFASKEVRLIVWPFFREFVTNMTARMHIPPIILPIRGEK